MQLSVLLTGALAVSANAYSVVLGERATRNSLTGVTTYRPATWMNTGSGVTPSTSVTVFGTSESTSSSGNLCGGQNCPITWQYGSCTIKMLSTSTSSAYIYFYSLQNQFASKACVKTTSYQATGSNTATQSWWRCDVGASDC